MHQPRDYQALLEQDVYAAWNGGARNVMAVLPTGGGKTFVFSRITSAVNAATCAIAHRGELVSQMSTAYAREGIRHRVIGPEALQRRCSAANIEDTGMDYVTPNARVAVAGVDTLARWSPSDPWLAQVRLWIQDEAHHVLADNKWGKAAKLFPNAFGLGPTATPIRADGKGLGRHADGLMDALVVGPSMRELIRRKFLTEYKIYAPPSDLDLSQVAVTGSGDFSPPQLSKARKQSHITGDVVQHYLRLARGKLGVTFDVDIESATSTAEAYRAAGIPAEVVTGKTPDAARAEILRRFKRREILQLVNVDLFGEGFDLPAIEVVSFARPTQSFSLYCQQFGRALRVMEGKPFAIIIDHVGNVLRHGLPDARREWTLDRRERRSRSTPTDVIPTRVCLNPECMGVYERTEPACPYCGHEPVPAGRSSPELVDGDLLELDAATLARLRGEIEAVDGAPTFPYGATDETVGAIKKRHWLKQQGQKRLRHAIALWAGWKAPGTEDFHRAYREFFFKFGIDTATAQTLGSRESESLAERIELELTRHNILERS